MLIDTGTQEAEDSSPLYTSQMDFLKEVREQDDAGRENNGKSGGGKRDSSGTGGGGARVAMSTDNAPFFIKRSAMKFVKTLGGTITLSKVDDVTIAFKVCQYDEAPFGRDLCICVITSLLLHHSSLQLP